MSQFKAQVSYVPATGRPVAFALLAAIAAVVTLGGTLAAFDSRQEGVSTEVLQFAAATPKQGVQAAATDLPRTELPRVVITAARLTTADVARMHAEERDAQSQRTELAVARAGSSPRLQ
jgi:hypothetical protein